MRHQIWLMLAGAANALIAMPAMCIDQPNVKWSNVDKSSTISALFFGKPISVRISSRTAGAVDSLIWNGQQFVNAHDHGREIQSASYYEGKGVCFNPTEGGSAADGTGNNSTSVLMSVNSSPGKLATVTRMAYWLGPGQTANECKGSVSTVKTELSDDVLTKTVTFGAARVENVISYSVDFYVPEDRSDGKFEAVTGYMPPEFNTFWSYNPAADALTQIDEGPGGQSIPLIFSTEDKQFALGVYSPPPQESTAVYGRWRFTNASMASPTVKWNCVFQENSVSAGNHRFNCYVLIGTLQEVRDGIRKLCARSEPRVCIE